MLHENDDESLLLDRRLSPIRIVQGVSEIARIQTYFTAKIAGQKYLQHHHAYERSVEEKFGDGLQWVHLQYEKKKGFSTLQLNEKQNHFHLQLRFERGRSKAPQH